MVAAMSQAARYGAADLIRRIRVPEPNDEPAGRVASAVTRALTEGRVLEIDYVDKAGASSRRTVEPIGLLNSGTHWYVLAWCRLRDDHRSFRLDRISAPCVRTEPARPRDLPDLECEPDLRLRQLAIEE
jgi:proteasome accessory factor B